MLSLDVSNGFKERYFYSGKCNFPGLLDKTEIPIIGFLGLEKPEQRKIPSTTATPINSTYYSFDYIEWYEYKNNKVGRKLNDGEAFDSGMYCCQLYFNMNRGYAVAKNAVCACTTTTVRRQFFRMKPQVNIIFGHIMLLQINHLHFHISSLRQNYERQRRNYIGYCQQCRKLSVADESKEKHRKICVAQHK